MLLSKPLPSELINAYAGRLRLLNGHESLRHTWQALFDYHKKHLNQTSLLAATAGLDLTGLIINHSLLPYRRSSTKSTTFLINEFKNPRNIDANIFRTKGVNPGFCPACIKQELSSLGYSYWHREHQLPGVDWCKGHDQALHRVDEPKAFEYLPLSFLGSRKTLIQTIEAKPQSGTIVDRYIKLSIALLNNPSPIPCRTNIRKVRARAKELNIELDALNGKKGVPMSTLVAKEYPAEWLKRFCPYINSRRDGLWFEPIDNSLITGAYTEMFVLFVAMLFDSVEDAVQFFQKRSAEDLEEALYFHNNKSLTYQKKFMGKS